MSGACTYDYTPSTDSYYLFVPSSWLCVILQTLLLIKTLHNEHTERKNKKFKGVLVMRILFIFIQVVALYWLIVDIFRMSIDPFTKILQNGIGCKITAYSIMYLPGLFYGGYLYHICERLATSFKGSYLELSKWSLYTLRTMVLIVPVVSSISLLIDDGDLDCVKEWRPRDMDRIITFCVVPPGLLIGYKYYISTILLIHINLMNIVFAIIFTVKLRMFMTNTVSDGSRTQDRFKFEALVLKNQILTICGVVSTSAGWAFFVATGSRRPQIIYCMYRTRNGSHF